MWLTCYHFDLDLIAGCSQLATFMTSDDLLTCLMFPPTLSNPIRWVTDRIKAKDHLQNLIPRVTDQKLQNFSKIYYKHFQIVQQNSLRDVNLISRVLGDLNWWTEWYIISATVDRKHPHQAKLPLIWHHGRFDSCGRLTVMCYWFLHIIFSVGLHGSH